MPIINPDYDGVDSDGIDFDPNSERESEAIDNYCLGLQAAIDILAIQREAPHRTEQEKNLIQFLINEISELMK